jgi:CubicO group peptidase (beta-lactamase class C family)
MAFCYRAAIILLLSSGSLVAAAAAAVQEDAHDLERKVDQVFAAYDKPDSPGCALGVIRDGEFLHKRGYGSGSLELGVSLTAQSIFYMGSVSKQFTAASVVLAAEQGYLSLDDDVRKYIPELPSYGYTITLRQMLHHTSGYRDDLALLLLAGGNFEDVHSTAEMLDLVSRQKDLNYVPGSEYLYSNTNFFLMSVVVQRATGRPLSQFAEDNIFKPLGMSHTRFYDDRTGVVAGRVPAYKPLAAGGFGIDWTTNFDMVGDGGLLSSVEDLLMWDRNFYANKLGKGTLLRELQTPGVLNNGKRIDYALGLFVGAYRGLSTVEHYGSLFGYRIEMLRFPQQKFSVICLCNLESIQPRILASHIADIYLEGQLSPEHPAAAVLHVDPQPFTGQYRNVESHSVLDLSVAEGDLAATGQHFKPLGPRQFAAASGEELTFEIKGGKAAALTLTATDTAPRRYEKFQPFKPSVKDLAQYAGVYTSSELPANYRFSLQDGHLTLAVNWRESTVLIPSVPDEFQDPLLGTSIVFRRDATGQIDGCDIFARQVRHIAFARAALSTH